MSNAYCAECLESGAEPYEDIVGLAFCIDGLDNACDEMQPFIDLSLAKAGKTRAEAEAEAKKIDEEYRRMAGEQQ